MGYLRTSYLVCVVGVSALTITPQVSEPQRYVWSEGGHTPYSPSLGLLRTIEQDRSEFDLYEDDEAVGSNMIIKPEYKLAFCYFPKVASAEFNGLFNSLNNIKKEDVVARGEVFHHFGAASPAKLNVSRNHINKNNGWISAFFTRDPLMRFLSAFGSKCLPKADGSPGDTKYCGGIVGQGKKDGWQIIEKPTDLDTMVEAFEKHVEHFWLTLYTKEGDLLTDNKHYMKQVDVIANECGEELFAPENVDFLGRLGGDVHRQVKMMLMMGGDEDADKDAENFFPKQSIAGHTSSSTHSFDKFYRNKRTKKMVETMYADDYKQLGKALPSEAPWFDGDRP